MGWPAGSARGSTLATFPMSLAALVPALAPRRPCLTPPAIIPPGRSSNGSVKIPPTSDFHMGISPASSDCIRAADMADMGSCP